MTGARVRYVAESALLVRLRALVAEAPGLTCKQLSERLGARNESVQGYLHLLMSEGAIERRRSHAYLRPFIYKATGAQWQSVARASGEGVRQGVV